ncbi:hypothetical protein LINPERHAP2_LOCUS3886, partial [Linum perenne]
MVGGGENYWHEDDGKRLQRSVLLRQLLPENPPHKLNLRILHTWKFWRSFKAGPIFCFRLRLFYRFSFVLPSSLPSYLRLFNCLHTFSCLRP